MESLSESGKVHILANRYFIYQPGLDVLTSEAAHAGYAPTIWIDNNWIAKKDFHGEL